MTLFLCSRGAPPPESRGFSLTYQFCQLRGTLFRRDGARKDFSVASRILAIVLSL
jgi:hypothetical protein